MLPTKTMKIGDKLYCFEDVFYDTLFNEPDLAQPDPPLKLFSAGQWYEIYDIKTNDNSTSITFVSPYVCFVEIPPLFDKHFYDRRKVRKLKLQKILL